MRWERPATLYRAGFPRLALPTLEWFQPRIEFEQWSERRKATPDWFIEQVVVRDHLKALQGAFDLFLRANERSFEDWRSKYEAAKIPWAAAIVVKRQGEYIQKTLADFEKFAAAETDYENAKVIQDLRGWPAGKREAFEGRLAAIQREHRIVVAKCAHTLVGLERPAHLPDYAGEFLLQTAQTLAEAIFQDDSVAFGTVFPCFFQASIKEMLSLLNVDAGENDWDRSQLFAVATSPIMDLVEISGFAMLASELHQTGGPWGSAQETWNRYLTEGEKSEVRINMLNDALTAVDIPGMIARGEAVRTGWRTQAQEWVTQSVGLAPSSTWSFFADGPERRSVQHPSALIRAFARETFPGMYRGIDVFASAFFTHLPGAEPSGHGARFNGFVDALRRESNRNQSESCEDGEVSEDGEQETH